MDLDTRCEKEMPVAAGPTLPEPPEPVVPEQVVPEQYVLDQDRDFTIVLGRE